MDVTLQSVVWFVERGVWSAIPLRLVVQGQVLSGFLVPTRVFHEYVAKAAGALPQAEEVSSALAVTMPAPPSLAEVQYLHLGTVTFDYGAQRVRGGKADSVWRFAVAAVDGWSIAELSTTRETH